VWNIWKVGHQPFKEGGDDNLFLATPNGNMLWTCDSAIIKQLFTLHTVQVPVDMLRFYDIWGPTVGSVEGEEWKTHRKIVTYGLNPSSLPMVWKEAIHQTDTLIERWATDKYLVPVSKYWTSRLALHTIASVFFNLKLEWKEYTQADEPTAEGYRISFASALFTVLARLGLIFMVPRALLRVIPLKAFKETYVALIDWTKYMQHLRARAAEDIEAVSAKRNKTILESIVVAGALQHSSGEPEKNRKPLSEASILGNIFFTLMAGHETAGNTLAFTLLLLSVYPEHQTAIQNELDAQLDPRPREDWTVEHDFQALQRGYLGAVLKEMLRLYNVVQFIFRFTVAPTTVHDAKGTAHVIPANTTCLISIAAAFQNPAIWTPKPVSQARRAELHHSQAIDFDPERWLDGHGRGKDDEENYWPFGYGARKCPGMPFAQVEMIAVLATLLKSYSLELVVSEEVLRGCDGDRNKAWEKTRDRAIRQLRDDVEANITIQMLKELPIRLVKRGEVSGK
jgi:cytochrome P450